MSRNTSAVLEKQASIRESYSAARGAYATKKTPHVSGDELARQINQYLERTEISPREYRVPGAE